MFWNIRFFLEFDSMMEKMNVMQIRKSSQSPSVYPSNVLDHSPFFFDILVLFFRGVDFFSVNVVQAQLLTYTHFFIVDEDQY